MIDQDNIVPEEYTTYFRSVIVFGKIRILDDEKEIKAAIEKLAIKYYPRIVKLIEKKLLIRNGSLYV